MPTAFYFDVHVDKAIPEQLHLRGVDVLRAQDDNATTFEDAALLERATFLRRVVFTHDNRFRHLAEEWQQQGKPFSGLLFGRQLGVTIGTYVQQLELIAKATEALEWQNTVQHLLFK